MGWSIHHPVGLAYYAPQHCYRGYTLLTTVRGYDAYLIDMEGQVCHWWHSNEGIEYAYLLPSGDLLLRTGGPPDADGAERIGGSSRSILELDWHSNMVWEYRDPFVHHDFERLPDGNTLVLAWQRLSPELPPASGEAKPVTPTRSRCSAT